MNKHTKGPWFKNEYRQILGSSGQRVCVDGFAFGTHSTEESQANDRRIVSCINACEGFSTEELDGANLFADSIASDAEIIALKKQRDELLAELKATESRLHEVSVFCATIEQQRDALLAATQYAADVFSGYVDTHKAMGDMGAEAQGNQQHLQVMLEAIAKAGGNIPPDCYRQRDELAEENVSQGQVWEVLNGVCSYGFYGTKDEAEKVCFDMQKSHDLSGSLAAFNVRPRYTKAGGES